MKTESLNRLAWQKLKQNKLAFSALLYIVFCVFVAIFAVVISPDSTKNANEMHIELATKKPLTKILFLEIPKERIEETSMISNLIFGTPSAVNRIPIEWYSVTTYIDGSE